MARAVGLALGLAMTSVIASPACGVAEGGGREDVAIARLSTVLCEVAQECDCAFVGAVCEQWQHLEPRGAFADECLEVWARWAESLQCGVSALPIEARLCPLYHGTIYEGFACDEWIDRLEVDPLATDCGAGLVCVTGRCRDPETIDFGARGQPCDIGFACDEGLYCQRQATCERIPGQGEACPDRICQADSQCDDEVCVRLPAEGEPCLRGNCASGLACDDGRCRRLAAVGEPCFGHRDCITFNCPAGFCASVPEPGDPCSNRLPCAPGQLCVEGSCEELPGEDDAGDGAPSLTCDLLFWF
ncbi:MAG: hypothetical protein KC501_42255 [Myxococcales bacterium]|nr:hypothetical protein [Myxococcales bacterium]